MPEAVNCRIWNSVALSSPPNGRHEETSFYSPLTLLLNSNAFAIKILYLYL